MEITEGNQLSKAPSYSGFLSWSGVGWSWGRLGVEWNSLIPTLVHGLHWPEQLL